MDICQSFSRNVSTAGRQVLPEVEASEATQKPW